MGLQIAGRAVAMLGAGTQGRRLAYMWSSKGRDVNVIDAQERQLTDAVKYIDELRAGSGRSGVKWGNIKTFKAENLKSALQNVWLVVECVPERVELKRKVITQLNELAPEDAIIASNSSSHSISEILEGLNLPNDRRILSAHSYWPPETDAIEIMGHSKTDPELVDFMLRESGEHGFSPFHVKQDSMGYIYNRIWAAIKREALFTAAEGVATPAEIDDIFKNILKTPKGPFEQMDVVGLDVVLDIENHYAEKRKDIPATPREYLKDYIKNGDLGVKSGRGFYDYGQNGTK
ncbi:hypothetical protein PV10_06616 [Exophiala mesophila]|uniref:3-hydroxybutyryl-CoA dehydrogenase n=1 Tax=Exophiala mesophila TaxID=212818 RepID=A0A0D1WSJ0_EXOME|nr:uncharacterized protein PV10_06616 [Exophiala mesophila]KIV92155.1 hypothetical protein PV10_06616 [Exophiala mesophila]